MTTATYDRMLGLLLVTVLAAGCGDSTGPIIGSPFVSVTTGSLHSCGVTEAGSVYCWGWNRDGQLGDGSTSDRSRPVRAQAGGVAFTAVTAGGGHTCALAGDGRAFCWGFNLNGQVGDGTLNNSRTAPTQVAGGLLFTQLSAGGSYTCGITTGQEAYCWGWNGNGQLGDGTKQDRSQPTLVSGGVGFRVISSGAFHTCALSSADEPYCWGSNSLGQLGTGSGDEATSPAAVSGGQTYPSINAGFEHSCAVTSAGEGFCWGNAVFGQLGTGSRLNENVPASVVGGIVFNRISAGGFFSCGVSTADEAYCWGLNGNGQLGLRVPGLCADPGTGVDFPCALEPEPVSGGLRFSSVAVGNQHSCGLTTDRIVYCWGLASNGQLGNGVSGGSDFSVDPVRVGGQQ